LEDKEIMEKAIQDQYADEFAIVMVAEVSMMMVCT